jgi:4-hydroxybutyrate CoA-transferase
LTVLVKYCGGCNPRYDRTAFVENLRREFPLVQFFYSGRGVTNADMVLAVCGCPSKCASHHDLHGRYGKLIVASADEYGIVRKYIRRIEGKSEK